MRYAGIGGEWSSLLKTHACPSASQHSIRVVAKAGIQMCSEKKMPKNRYLQCSTSVSASAHPVDSL